MRPAPAGPRHREGVGGEVTLYPTDDEASSASITRMEGIGRGLDGCLRKEKMGKAN